MQWFMIPCIFGDRKAAFPIYVAEPAADTHPLEQQAAWLWRERGGLIPEDVMTAVADLQSAALDANVPFEEYFEYATEALRNEDTEGPHI